MPRSARNDGHGANEQRTNGQKIIKKTRVVKTRVFEIKTKN
ncbi:hypothetical protein SPONN_2490 [uncultured Candidatus Thioglobus sp.]|nr:hypothetical protein SPONN_2490 [uncultured Candidatus Thioglobus sp.]